jgi:hypothetical protein
VQKINHVRINSAESNPLVASSYIELPKYLKGKKAVINVKNNDNKCFGYAILSILLYSKIDYKTNRSNQKLYDKHFAELGLEKITYSWTMTRSRLSKIF